VSIKLFGIPGLARSGDGLTRLSLPLHSLSSDRFTSPSGAVWPVFLDSPHFLPFSLSTPLLLLPLLSTPSRSLQLPPTRRKISSSTTSLRNSWALPGVLSGRAMRRAG